MKVKIGPYRNDLIPIRRWERNYEWFRSNEYCHDEKDWKWYDKIVYKVLEGLDNLVLPINLWFCSRPRKVKIHIDKYDTWDMDHTLGLIILPLLKQMKATKQGSPGVDDIDVPEELRATTKENDWDIDDNWHKRWEWVLDEMIWAFEQIVDSDNDDAFFDHSKNPMGYDREGHLAHNERIIRGTTLFGKYYQGLWD